MAKLKKKKKVNPNHPAISAKYVFLDIVHYSEGRSIEAQTKIIRKLNGIVLKSLKKHGIKKENTVLIPTGDGICIAILDYAISYDCHLKLALDILKLMEDHNGTAKQEMRQFKVRIGLNENIDNMIIDINGRKNLAGKGINLAQRIMDQGDGSQIMVGQASYEKLAQREKYLNHFKEFVAADKHNSKFSVYQFIDDQIGLNVDIPKRLEEKMPLDVLLGKIIVESDRVKRLEIIFAEYGSTKNRINVTQEIKKKVLNNKLSILADNEIAGDPDSGVVDKWLYVIYAYEGNIHLKYVAQSRVLEIP